MWRLMLARIDARRFGVAPGLVTESHSHAERDPAYSRRLRSVDRGATPSREPPTRPLDWQTPTTDCCGASGRESLLDPRRIDVTTESLELLGFAYVATTENARSHPMGDPPPTDGTDLDPDRKGLRLSQVISIACAPERSTLGLGPRDAEAFLAVMCSARSVSLSAMT